MLALSADFSADADDFRMAGTQVIAHVGVVIAAPRFWHQHVDLLTDDFRCGVSKYLGCGPSEGLHNPVLVDGDEVSVCISLVTH